MLWRNPTGAGQIPRLHRATSCSAFPTTQTTNSEVVTPCVVIQQSRQRSPSYSPVQRAMSASSIPARMQPVPASTTRRFSPDRLEVGDSLRVHEGSVERTQPFQASQARRISAQSVPSLVHNDTQAMAPAAWAWRAGPLEPQSHQSLSSCASQPMIGRQSGPTTSPASSVQVPAEVPPALSIQPLVITQKGRKPSPTMKSATTQAVTAASACRTSGVRGSCNRHGAAPPPVRQACQHHLPRG